MPRPKYEPGEYLTPRGRRIFLNIVNHIEENSELMLKIDTLELSMIANSFDMYQQMMERMGGVYTQLCKNGVQPRPEYNIMQQCYKNILTHSSKFGLNPGDRERIFSGMKKKKTKSLGDDLDGDVVVTMKAGAAK